MVPIKTYKLITFMQFSKIEMTYYIVIKISLEQGSPTSEPWTSTSCPISGGVRLEIEQGSPTSKPWTSTSSPISGGMRLEIEQGSLTSEPWTSTSCPISGGIRLEIEQGPRRPSHGPVPPV